MEKGILKSTMKANNDQLSNQKMKPFSIKGVMEYEPKKVLNPEEVIE